MSSKEKFDWNMKLDDVPKPLLVVFVIVLIFLVFYFMPPGLTNQQRIIDNQNEQDRKQAELINQRAEGQKIWNSLDQKTKESIAEDYLRSLE